MNTKPKNNHIPLDSLPPVRLADQLASPNVDQQAYLRMSGNAAFSFRRNDGQSALVCELYQAWLDDLTRRETPAFYDLNDLKSKELVQKAMASMRTIPELQAFASDDGHVWQRMWAEWSQRKPNAINRQLAEIAHATAKSAVQPLLETLRRHFVEAPHSLGNKLQDVQKSLREHSLSPPDRAPFADLDHALRIVEQLKKLPRDWQGISERLQGSLRSSIEALIQSSFVTGVCEAICAALAEELEQLHEQIEQLRTSVAKYEQQLRAIGLELNQRHMTQRSRHEHVQSTVLLELPTVDLAQLLAGLKPSWTSHSRHGLQKTFVDQSLTALREHARLKHAHVQPAATWTELILQLPAQDIADVFGTVVAELIGDKHTVYSAIRAYGIEKAAYELFTRAAPLCDLSGRDHTALNIEVHQDVMVRMPEPRGPEDSATAEALRQAFQQFPGACQFHTDQADSEISVLRTLVGFPIGVEQSNKAMLAAYQDSAKQGHHPHLVGILSESPDGRHLPQLLKRDPKTS